MTKKRIRRGRFFFIPAKKQPAQYKTPLELMREKIEQASRVGNHWLESKYEDDIERYLDGLGRF